MGQAPPHFVVKVVTEVDGRKCDWQHSMAHLRKSRCRRKNLADILYTDQVTAFFVQNFIANFVPNFIVMAMGVDRRKMQLAAFDGPSPKTPL